MRPDWTYGNRFTLLENGEGYYPRVFEAIANARREVYLETFILFDDKVGRELQQVLIRAARNGAEVHVLVDGWGSPDLGPSILRPLLDAGVDVRAYEPLRGLLARRLNMFRRMHRKIVVVDDAVAFVGGINYSVDHLAEFGKMAKRTIRSRSPARWCCRFAPSVARRCTRRSRAPTPGAGAGGARRATAALRRRRTTVARRRSSRATTCSTSATSRCNIAPRCAWRADAR